MDEHAYDSRETDHLSLRCERGQGKDNFIFLFSPLSDHESRSDDHTDKTPHVCSNTTCVQQIIKGVNDIGHIDVLLRIWCDDAVGHYMPEAMLADAR